MRPRRIAALALSLLALVAPARSTPAQQPYDVVLRGGRVMDPESGLDAVRDVGIRGGKIAAISTTRLAGRDVIDATGLVVAPGFIDLHAHGQDSSSFGFYARDGVTTALELELGVFPVKAWYDARGGRQRINYGASVSHRGARIALYEGRGPDVDFVGATNPKGDWAYRRATDDEIAKISANMEEGLDEGALGMGFGINYTPAAARDEIYTLFKTAARRRVPVFVHARAAGEVEPLSSMDAVQELLADATATGASLHIVHIGSTGLGRVPMLLEMIDATRRRGVDVTTEAYPYTAGSTLLQSAIFDEGWQKNIGITYKDLQWSATGERLTPETFEKYRKQGGWVVIHMIPEASVRAAMASPLVMVASDAVPLVNGGGHPRGAGTFARVLGHYVREEHALSLMDALRKMTLMPARRLEAIAPAMRGKGRVKIGADADLTLFDPARVIDRATYEKAAQYSDGISFVLVNGTPVVRDGQLVPDATPGRPITGRPSSARPRASR